jgi:hypothetical protein
MGNSIFFDLKLREFLTPGLHKALGVSRYVFGEIDKNVQKTVRGLDYLTRPMKLDVDTSGLRQVSNDLDNIGHKMRGLGTMDIAKGTAVGHLAMRGLERGMDMVKDAARETFEAGSNAEQQLIGLRTFVGADGAKKWYSRIQEESTVTPYTTKDILPGEQMLISAGRTPEKALKDLHALMNSLSAVGKAGDPFYLELGESHLAQMASQGKADATFMREFQRTLGIPMGQLLGDYMFPKSPRKGAKQIAEWTESGELKDHVTYDMFVGAMEKAADAGGRFAGALYDQSQTIKGKGSTIMDYLDIGMSKLALDERVHERIISLENRVIEMVKGMPGMIDHMAGGVADFLKNVEELVDWMSANRHVLKTWGAIAKYAAEAWLMYKGLGMAVDVVRGLRGLGAAGAVGMGAVESAGGMSLFRGAGMAAGAIEAFTGMAVTSVLGIVGGVAGIAGLAYAYWKGLDKNEVARVTASLNADPAYKQRQVDLGMKGGDPHGSTTLVQAPIDFFDKVMGVKPAGKAGSSAAAGPVDVGEDLSDKIISGGRKQTIVNVNAPFYKVEHQVLQNFTDSLNDLEPKVKEIFLRILQSANAAT